MRICFFGTSDFSVPSLDECCSVGTVVAVVTQPDKDGDRGAKAYRPVADRARELGIPILGYARLKPQEVLLELTALDCDVFVVASYGKIIPKALLDIPRCGAINVHGSLLPRWRGASPIQASILQGDSESGVTIMQMDEGMDTGGIIASIAVPLTSTVTTPELSLQLSHLGASTLGAVLHDLAMGKQLHGFPQDEAQATYTSKLIREDGDLDFTKLSAIDVDRKLRALTPWPGSRCDILGHEVTLTSGRPIEIEDLPKDTAAGAIVGWYQNGIVVKASQHTAFLCQRVTPPGKRTMDALSFYRGIQQAPKILQVRASPSTAHAPV